MSKAAEPPASDAERRRQVNLVRIAAALKCKPSIFFDVPAIGPLADMVELVRLWRTIPNEAGRARVLACAREEACREPPTGN